MKTVALEERDPVRGRVALLAQARVVEEDQHLPLLAVAGSAPPPIAAEVPRRVEVLQHRAHVREQLVLLLAGGPAIRQRDDQHPLCDGRRVDGIAKRCVSRGQTPDLVALPLQPGTFQKAGARLGAAANAEFQKLLDVVVMLQALVGSVNVSGGGVEARGGAPIVKLVTEADVADAQDSRPVELVVSEVV